MVVVAAAVKKNRLFILMFFAKIKGAAHH